MCEISTNTGISARTVLFELENVVPFKGFPIDIMHSFFNVQNQLLSLHMGDQYNDVFELSMDEARMMDNEIVNFVRGISGQIAPAPRKLSEFTNWKAVEHREFTLSYMMIFFDGILPKDYLDGLNSFVELTDLCFRTSLSEVDVERIGRLSRTFVAFYERCYFRYNPARVSLCKYVIRLLIHLEESTRFSWPLVCCSQYWVEKYIGWTVDRLNAKVHVGSSMSQNAIFYEAYKMFYHSAFCTNDTEFENLVASGGVEMKGSGVKCTLSRMGAVGVRLRALMTNYLVRKIDGLTLSNAKRLALRIPSCHSFSQVRVVSGGAIQTAQLNTRNGRSRPSSYIAIEMEASTQELHVYYGKLVRLLKFELSDVADTRLIGTSFAVAMVAWVSGLQKGQQDQVYKLGPTSRIFGGCTMEDITIIQRLIGVVEHSVTISEMREGRRSVRREKRSYIVDHAIRRDALLSPTRVSSDGLNRVLKGMMRTG